MDDEDIVTFLRKLTKPTFFTRDGGFFRAELSHSKYGIVWLDVRVQETAKFVRKMLRCHRFDTWAKRKGLVVGLSAEKIKAWRYPSKTLDSFSWMP